MKNKFYSKTLVLVIVTIACQVVNLLRDILLANSLGTSAANDIYLMSQTIIAVVIAMVNSPMATAFVPVASKYYVNSTIEEKNKFISKIYCNIGLLALGLMLLEFVFLDVIVEIVAPGFNPNDISLLKQMVLIQLPITVINILKGVNRGNFQILQKFNISEILQVMPYLCMCIYLVLPGGKSLHMIAIILSIATCLSIIPEFIILYRSGFRFRPIIGFDEDVFKMLKLMAGATAAAMIREVNIMFDKAIGSMLPEGSITMLSYASKLTVVVVGVVSTAISVVGFSQMALLIEKNDKESVKKSIIDSCNLINFFIIPISFFLILFAKEIIQILFFRGDFTITDVEDTARVMQIYAVGLIGYGFQDVFTRALHAKKIIKCTIRQSFIMVIINIVLNLLLYKRFEMYGVAAATSISILAVIPLLARDVNIHIGKINFQEIIKETLKVTIASLMTVMVIGCLKSVVNNTPMLIMFICLSILSLIVFLFMCKLFRCSVLAILIKSINFKSKS